MPMYQASTLTFASARSYVAAARGAEGDSVIESLAGRALSAAFERYANFWRWEHYFAVSTAYATSAGTVIAAFTGTVISAAASGATTMTLSPANTGFYTAAAARPSQVPGSFGFLVDIQPSLFDLPYTTLVDSTGVMTLYGGLPVDVAANSTITFKHIGIPMPADVRDIYDVTLLKSGRALKEIDQRYYDAWRYRNSPGTLTHYGTFGRWGAATGSLQIYPPPLETDQLMVRYYRAPSPPSATATVLDMPRDAEHAVLSLAKSYLMADVGGEETRMSLWRQEGEAALRELRQRENQKPDASPGLRPGYDAPGLRIGPNETWPYLMEG